VALVTGGAGGIGEAIARRLLADGWRVVAADLDGEAASRSVEHSREWLVANGECDHQQARERAIAIGGDVSDAAGATDSVAAVLRAFGRLDLLVNNAGGGVLRPFLDHDEESIAQTLTRNLLTTIHCCRAAIPALKKTRGRIVNIGADSVRTGLALHAMYNAAKGGVHGLTTGLARELAPDGVTVNCVAPAIVATDSVNGMLADPGRLDGPWQAMLREAVGIIPLGRPGSVEEVASTVSYLASGDAGFITGQVISVNGGSSML
jgi:2,3-dihydroxy-2,3-dihydro-p-cumate dehydrogenase